MAVRRMLHRDSLQSDRFISMSKAAQITYVGMSLNADDDGLIGNPKGVLRITDNSPDSLQELIEAGYIHRFESGVIVILDWHVHNYIRKDRYCASIFKNEYACLRLQENLWYTIGIPDDDQVRAKDRLELGKERDREEKGQGDYFPLTNKVYKSLIEKDIVLSDISITHEQKHECENHLKQNQAKIKSAISNYVQIFNDRNSFLFSPYSKLYSFIMIGIDKYCDEANPLKALLRPGADPIIPEIDWLEAKEEAAELTEEEKIRLKELRSDTEHEVSAKSDFFEDMDV